MTSATSADIGRSRIQIVHAICHIEHPAIVVVKPIYLEYQHTSNRRERQGNGPTKRMVSRAQNTKHTNISSYSICGLKEGLELEERADFAGGVDAVAKLLGHLMDRAIAFQRSGKRAVHEMPPKEEMPPNATQQWRTTQPNATRQAMALTREYAVRKLY